MERSRARWIQALCLGCVVLAPAAGCQEGALLAAPPTMAWEIGVTPTAQAPVETVQELLDGLVARVAKSDALVQKLSLQVALPKDPDGDGIATWVELLAGTDPAKDGSFPRDDDRNGVLDAFVGREGPPGPVGLTGPPGPAGAPGIAGAPGRPGRIARDAVASAAQT